MWKYQFFTSLILCPYKRLKSFFTLDRNIKINQSFQLVTFIALLAGFKLSWLYTPQWRKKLTSPLPRKKRGPWYGIELHPMVRFQFLRSSLPLLCGPLWLEVVIHVRGLIYGSNESLLKWFLFDWTVGKKNPLQKQLPKKCKFECIMNMVP